jgi:hypothetical protein
VAVGLVVVLCTVVAALSMERLPLWSVLLGTAALAGGYEFTYNAAPPELLDTSASTATTLLFTVGVGFLAASLFAPPGDGTRTSPAPGKRAVSNENTALDEIMEPAK